MTDILIASLSTAIMTLEILAGECVFATLLSRRKFFPLRLVGSAMIGINVLITILLLYSHFSGNIFIYGTTSGPEDAVFQLFFYILAFAFTVGMVRFCYRGSMFTILFYCSGGYAVQHISVKITELIRLAIPFDHPLFFYVIEIPICAAVYLAVYFLFLRGRVMPKGDREIRGKVVLCLVVLFICVGISRMTTADDTRSIIAVIAECTYAIVSCSLVLGMLFTMTEKSSMEDKVDAMSEMLHRERAQYLLSKETIELINIKCHDLKYQIKALKEGRNSPERFEEIENAIVIYDSGVKTGNDALDVILTEKSLFCERNNILLTCSLNGRDLGFMDEVDIYTLFGNAMSNAIEGVSSVEDRSERAISVNGQTVGGVFSVHIENYFSGQIRFENGLPVTFKDKREHGYGMKSMERIVKQYGGIFSASATGNRFSLDMVFPLPHKP